MNVLYLGKFRYFYSTENYVSAALKHAGCNVTKLDYNSSIAKVFKKVSASRPDFVLFSKPHMSYYPELIDKLKAEGLLTVCWQFDLFFGFGRRPIPQFACDLLFTTDGGHQAEFERRGFGHHRVLRQGIHKPDHFMVKSLGYRWDVVFVGNRDTYRYRSRLVSEIERKYRSRFYIHTNTRGTALNKALSEAKVVLGDSYPSANYWSNRVYEITGRGGFLLHPKTEGLEAEFVDGEHYASYERNPQAAVEAIDYWLSNTEERERIRAAGWERCGDFTYDTRAAELLRQVQQAQQGATPPSNPA